MSENSQKIRSAPNSKESEMMVLGCMLTSVNGMNIAADGLDESDFYFTEHKIVFETLKNFYKNDKPADVHILCEELKRQDKLKSVGGIAYITTLAQYAGTSAYVEEYTDIVRNKAILRRMINASQVVEKKALEEPQDVLTALDDAQQLFFQISQTANPISGKLIGQVLSGAKSESPTPFLKELEERQTRYLERGPEESGITGLSTGLNDLDKMINGLNNSNLMILAARPAMGKCVTGDTLIIDPLTGALNPIKELVNKKQGHVATLGENWELQKTIPTAFIADGVKPTFLVKTALGREIEATAVHPLLTISGWKRVEELKVDDRIAVPRSLPFFGDKNWSEHKIKALAYFIADGCLTESCPSFTNINVKIVDDFTQAIDAFGSVKIRKETINNRAPSYYVSLDKKSFYELRQEFANGIKLFLKDRKKQLYDLVDNLGLCKTNVCLWANATNMPNYSTSLVLERHFPELPSLSHAIRANPVTTWLESLKLMGKNSFEKFLPSEVFELKKSSIALLINRLFSCDGTAYLANAESQPFPVIVYASVSKKLIHQIQHLLLRFGILAKIRSKKTKANDKVFSSYELEIHGKEGITLFCEQIGIFGKEEAVAKVLNYVKSIAPGWTKDTLPLAIWDKIREKRAGRSWSSLFIAKGLKAPSNLHDGKRSIRRDTLAKLAYVLDDAELKQLAESDVYWDTIVSIEATGEKEVFDLTVEPTHNFVAGDIIVHNTALAINIAENVCFKNNIPVGIFSLEMSADQLVNRIVCSQSEVESDKIKTGSLSGIEFQRIFSAVNMMQNHMMVIDDQPGLKITDLRARARRMKETYGIKFLVIDYLQLITGSGSRSQENRQNEISEISRLLKNLARELNVPILCLSQLSRKVEERPGHRPMMSDLRESGSIEQDADIVFFLLRREYYDPMDKPGLAELIVAKNRHGGVGTVNLTYRKEVVQFANYTPVKYPQDSHDDEIPAGFSHFAPN